MPRYNHKIASLEYLRDFLAMIVVAAHSWQIFSVPFVVDNKTSFLGLAARLAVIWFFCLSGYLISLNIHNHIRQNTFFKPSQFLLSRAFRILPPLICVFILTMILSFILQALGWEVAPGEHRLLQKEFSLDIDKIYPNIISLFTQGDLTGGLIVPLWSLTYELQLYVLAALLVFCLRSIQPPIIRTLGLLLLSLYVYALELFDFSPILNIQKISFGCFLLGVSGFFIQNKLSEKSIGLLAAASLGVMLLLFNINSEEDVLSMLDSSLALVVFQLVASLLFMAVTVLLVRVPRLKSLKPYVGYSYTVYIFHFPFLLFCYNLLSHLSLPFIKDNALGLVVIMCFLTVYISKKLGSYLENAKIQENYCKNFISGIYRQKVMDYSY